MSPHVKTKAFLALLASLAVLGGCGANTANVPLSSQSATGGAFVPPPTGPGKGKKGGIIYTAQLYGNEIGIYKPSPRGLISEGSFTNGVSAPQGSVTTPSGWLFVANGGDEDVLVYDTKKVKAGGSPTDVLEDYGQTPVNVDVNASRNLVAVSNSGTASQSGSVSVYLNRAAAPARTLMYGNDLLQGYGIALDKQGNCYWGVYDTTNGTGYIVEFSQCNGSGSKIINNVGDAGGLAFDQSGDLFYIDRSGSMPAIVACKKISSKGCTTNTFYQLLEPINLNFEKHDKVLWVADAAGYVDEFSVKVGKPTITFVQQYPVGSSSDPPFGIAPNPGG